METRAGRAQTTQGPAPTTEEAAIAQEEADIDAQLERIDRELQGLEGAYHPATCENGKFKPVKNSSLEMLAIDTVEEKEPDWLITDYMPRYQITSLAGDGGSGKTTVWCALAAAVSSGKMPFMVKGLVPESFAACKPQKVMFFSAEDSTEHTLKRRLRKNGAKLDNIFTIDIADERFPDVKFNSPFLAQLLEKHRPTLCIFDPIQAFIPPDVRMGDRNAMRNCLSPLIGYGEKYGTTFLIVEHANKQSGVWGRKRIADSADIWDISRSVIMAGETNEKGVRYLSHEKSNYGPTGQTILYRLEGEVVEVVGHTDKKDKDFVSEVDYSTRQAPQREEAKNFILNFLKDGEKELSELSEMASAVGISDTAMRRAKEDLSKAGKIKITSSGYGHEKKFSVRLLDQLPI
jgi:RecA-family ATPase